METSIILTTLTILAALSPSVAEFVRCETTKGDFTIEMHPEWAPLGHERFMEMVEEDFFKDQALYRVVPGKVVQFGLHADAEVQKGWHARPIKDDPLHPKFDPDLGIPWEKGTVTLGGSHRHKHHRTTGVLINLGTHHPDGHQYGSLESHGHERPIGKLVSQKDIDVVESFYSGYGDLKYLQGDMVRKGNTHAILYHPKLDMIKTCKVWQGRLESGGEM